MKIETRALSCIIVFLSIVSVAYPQFTVDHVKVNSAVTISIQATMPVEAGRSFTITIFRSAGHGPSEFRLRKPDLSWVYGGSHMESFWAMGTFSDPGDYWAYVDGDVYLFTISYISTGEKGSEGATRAPEAGLELSLPMGGTATGPEGAQRRTDESSTGPGGWRFFYLEEKNLVPMDKPTDRLTRIPAPGEPGFVAESQKNLIPGDQLDDAWQAAKLPSTTEKKNLKKPELAVK
jgi:hypothetical protein